MNGSRIVCRRKVDGVSYHSYIGKGMRMRVTFKEEDDYIHGATLDCNVAEWLIINKALRLLVNSEDCHKDDVAKIEQMLEEIQESRKDK